VAISAPEVAYRVSVQYFCPPATSGDGLSDTLDEGGAGTEILLSFFAR
jgi:hypothetical protein